MMKNFKKNYQIIALIALVLTLSVGCKKDDTTDLSGTYTFEKNQTHSITKDGNNLTITATDVQDSRCPINAVCVTAGYASVNLKIKENDLKEKTIMLCIGLCGIVDSKNPQNITLNGVSYYINLQEVDPYLQLNKNGLEPKKAIIVLTKK